MLEKIAAEVEDYPAEATVIRNISARLALELIVEHDDGRYVPKFRHLQG